MHSQVHVCYIVTSVYFANLHDGYSLMICVVVEYL
jgi:hypothetical protein